MTSSTLKVTTSHDPQPYAETGGTDLQTTRSSEALGVPADKTTPAVDPAVLEFLDSEASGTQYQAEPAAPANHDRLVGIGLSVLVVICMIGLLMLYKRLIHRKLMA